VNIDNMHGEKLKITKYTFILTVILLTFLDETGAPDNL